MPIVVVLAFAVTLVLFIEGTRKFRQSRPLPPGPTPIPLLGNVTGMFKDALHDTHTTWAKTYGDIVYTRVFGKKFITLNSEQTAIELLEKRSQTYSSRPMPVLSDLFGFEWMILVVPYGPEFRLQRRLLHQAFHAKAVLTYYRSQLQSAYELLTKLLDDSACYDEHFTTFTAAIVMAVTYGYDVKGKETFVTSMQRALKITLSASTPLRYALFSTFPFLKALPAWFPGMGFKSEVAECRRLVSEALHAPYAWVKQRIEEGNALPSMVADAITQHRLYDDSENPELVQAIKHSSGSLYSAAIETTNAILVTFVYLMMNHPEIQRRAQAEIDRVVGRQRLPNFEDRVSLPYVDALLRETMRWHPVAPWVIRVMTEDDVYRGYHIPQGAVVLINIWAMAHNENKYPHPDVFMPERFLLEDGTLNEDRIPWIFGFGRRVCPGKHVADASLWSAIVCMLALFRIEKKEGSENVKWTTGIMSRPLRFPCKFIPRDEEMDSQKLTLLIRASGIEL